MNKRYISVTSILGDKLAGVITQYVMNVGSLQPSDADSFNSSLKKALEHYHKCNVEFEPLTLEMILDIYKNPLAVTIKAEKYEFKESIELAETFMFGN